MPLKSSEDRYGSVAVTLHWLCAFLILLMIPLGYIMQNVQSETRLLAYRVHVGIGLVVLLLTLARLVWKLLDTKPNLTPGLSGIHAKGMKVVHVLLYFVLLALISSGVALGIQSELFVGLKNSATEFADFSLFRSRQAHGFLAVVYLALLVAHIGGVIVHQLRHGQVVNRMGIGKKQD
jgi:cytochrome b561